MDGSSGLASGKSERISSTKRPGTGNSLLSGASQKHESKVTVALTRHSHMSDADAISQLLTPFTRSLFANQNPAKLIEQCTISLSCFTADDELVAFGAFSNYPLQPRPCRRIPREWQSWIEKHYADVQDVSRVSSLFCHMIVAKAGFQLGLFKEIIGHTFQHMPEVNQIMFVSAQDIDVGVALNNIGNDKPLQRSAESLENEKLENEDLKHPLPPYPTVLRCHRFEYHPVLNVRHAVQGDADDVTAMFDATQKEYLEEQFGKYFIAEIIKRSSPELVSLVAEHYGQVVGYVFVSSRLDVDVMCANYQLEIFNNLQSSHPQKTPTASTATLDASSGKLSSQSDTAERSALPEVMISAPSPATTSQVSTGLPSTSQSDIAADVQSSSSALKSSLKSQVMSSTQLSDITRRKLASGSMLKSQVRFGESTVIAADDSDSSSGKPESTSSSGDTDEPGDLSPTILAPRDEDSLLTKSVVLDDGASKNAFAVRLFAMNPDYESRFCDFLPFLFELFENMEYCVMAQPSLSRQPQIFDSFHHADRRVGSNEPSELYLLHRNSLLNNYNVDYIKDDDMEAVTGFLSELDESDVILQDVEKYLFAGRDAECDGGARIHAICITCCEEMVAVAVIRDILDPDWLRAHYDVDEQVAFDILPHTDHKYLHHYAVNPSFLPRQRFLLGEVMRLSNASSVFYEVQEGRNRYLQEDMARSSFSMTPVLDSMTICRPRRQVVYSGKLEIQPSKHITRKKPSITMFMMNYKLLHGIKVVCNARIVVVGASNAGLAILTQLTGDPYIRFNNLILIDPYGIPGLKTPKNPTAETALPSNLTMNPAAVSQSGLTVWVTVVKAKMTSLNRNRREVILENRCRVPYDELIITTGTQYSAVRSVYGKARKITGLALKQLEASTCRNVISYSTLRQADKTVSFVKKTLCAKPLEGPVVVYGNTLECFTAIEMLLSNNIQGKDIQFVCPPSADGKATSCFADRKVEATMLKVLKDLGVQVVTSQLLVDWVAQDEDGNSGVGGSGSRAKGNKRSGSSMSSKSALAGGGKDDPKPPPLLQLMFTDITGKENSVLTATALFYFDQKTVDQDAFLAVNSSRLVFDGRVVIDENFVTADPGIRAAGSCTKYKLKLYRDDWKPERFNTEEHGRMLAKILLDKYIGLPADEVFSVGENLTPWMKEKITVRAALPGGHMYVRVCGPPRMKLSLEPGPMDKKIMTDTESGYFAIEFVKGKIDTITILTKREDVEFDNLSALWGYHSNMLKRLMDIDTSAPSADLFEALRQGWVSIFYHDRFPQLLEQILALTYDPTSDNISDESTVADQCHQSLVDFTSKLMETTHDLPDKYDMKELRLRYESSDVIDAMHHIILDYIVRNQYHLPMYAYPNIIMK